MNILRFNLLTTKASSNRRLLFKIDARSLITSTAMKRNHSASASGSGRSGRKGPTKRTGKPLEKFGATSEESYFYGKQKEQLEQLKKEMKKEIPVGSRKKDKPTHLLKKLSKKKFNKSIPPKKGRIVDNIFVGLLTKTRRPCVSRKEPKIQ